MFLWCFSAYREEVKLGAVNSINWARVLAQMTYYFWAHFRVSQTIKFFFSRRLTKP